MCGIAGYWGKTPLEPERLQQASKVLQHRGPDDSGIYQQQHPLHCVALVHRRLSILDLDPRSAQPFRLGHQVLSYNGEIYNYVEIRQELISLGHVFRTTGDTEVLAVALKQWGVDALDRLEGMWAFAWYDEQAGRLLLSRDRFGEKPLYLWDTPEGLFFASEVKGLAALKGQWPDVNQNHLLRYLVNGYKALYKTAETFHQGVWELTAGTNLWVEADGSKQEQRYWVPKLQIREDWAFTDAVEATREELIRAVRIRMRSDVPLAFCQSGGIDSNSLISIASRELGKEVHGYTIVNTDARYEEAEMVQHMVQEVGIKHTQVPLNSEGFLDNLAALVKQHDGPISTISYYVHHQLMQAMQADGYKVTISGTGADELFTGYYDHHNLYLAEVAKDPLLFSESINNWNKHLRPIVRNPYIKDPELYLKQPDCRSHIYLNNDVFASWLENSWQEDFFERDYGVTLLRNRMLNETFEESIPVILHEDDLNAMSVSLENRSPFLDRGLFETAFTIPTQHLIRDGKAKVVLREAMRGIVPDQILDNRRKVGFNAPILDLLDVSNAKVREQILDPNPVFELVRRDKVEELLQKVSLENSESKFLFNFVNMKLVIEN